MSLQRFCCKATFAREARTRLGGRSRAARVRARIRRSSLPLRSSAYGVSAKLTFPTGFSLFVNSLLESGSPLAPALTRHRQRQSLLSHPRSDAFRKQVVEAGCGHLTCLWLLWGLNPDENSDVKPCPFHFRWSKAPTLPSPPHPPWPLRPSRAAARADRPWPCCSSINHLLTLIARPLQVAGCLSFQPLDIRLQQQQSPMHSAVPARA